jgi:hypothetical protein
MNEKLRAQLDKLFVDAPPTRRAAELERRVARQPDGPV